MKILFSKMSTNCNNNKTKSKNEKWEKMGDGR